MRIVGALVLVVSFIVGAIGALWLLLALIGTEWDYCPSGNDCVPGELMGFVLLAAGTALAVFARRLARAR